MNRTLPRTVMRERGVTLVELMVAMAIGLIVVAGLSLMFANSSRSGRELEGTSRQIENGRYAAELLAQEIAAAGFYGDVPQQGAVYTEPGACSTDVALLGWDQASKKRPVALEGKSASELGTLACVTQPLPGSAGLVLRRADTVPTAQADIDDSKGIGYVQTSQCNADPANIEYLFGSQKSGFTLRNLNCTGPGQVRRYLSRIYYVAACNECAGTAADTVPTLKRAELQGADVVVTPLATGIERMAVEYGFDTDYDGTPDTYRTGPNATPGTEDGKWSNVVTARIYVLARAAEVTAGYVDSKTYVLGLSGTLGPFNDAYKRKVFVTTAKIQNVAGPRER
ncbi:MAG: PilW family protein [Curvibacter sp.]